MNKATKTSRSNCAVIRNVVHIVLILVLIVAAGQQGWTQSNAKLQTYFQQNIGLTQDQITAIQSGKPVAKALPSRTPAEVFLFGAIYINASPDSYLKFSRDYARLRKLPGNLALGVFSKPPKLSDLNGFTLESDDITALKGCKPSNCPIQIPASSIEEFQKSIDWSKADASSQVNQLLQKNALQRLVAYQSQGDSVLGTYNDKNDPTVVSKQFAYMLSYAKALPATLPDFYNYLLSYPGGKPANVEDLFYWTRVKFGLKPTLRVVQVVTMTGTPIDQIAYSIAEKQLYSSHYFETALDFAFCVRNDDPKKPGFYLIMEMGSEQAGLTGVKGSIVRREAVGRGVSGLQKTLTTIKSTLEAQK